MMILLCQLSIKSEGTRFHLGTLDNEITTQLFSFSIISFLTEKFNILCSDIFLWTSVLHRAMGRISVILNDSNLKKPPQGVLYINLDRDPHLRIFLVYPKKITGFKFQPPKITAFFVPKINVSLVLQSRWVVSFQYKIELRTFTGVETAALTFRTKQYSTSYSGHICDGKWFYNDFFLNHHTIALVNNCLKLLSCVVIETALDLIKKNQLS